MAREIVVRDVDSGELAEKVVKKYLDTGWVWCGLGNYVCTYHLSRILQRVGLS